jgi:hypothetical protein
MRTCTKDPISLNDVTDLDSAPFTVEGEGESAVKIYFESVRNMQEYLEMEEHGAFNTPGVRGIYDEIADNPDTGTIN